MQAETNAPPLSPATTSTAARIAPGAVAPITQASGKVCPALVLSLASQNTHLKRLQYTQAICETKPTPPCYLTVADARLTLRGREGHFGPLFARYRLSLDEVCEALCWAADKLGGESLLEDIVQHLVARHGEEQYTHHRQVTGRGT